MRKALDEARREPRMTLVTGSARLATRPGRKRRAATRGRPEGGLSPKEAKCVRFSGRKWGERCTHWRQYVSVDVSVIRYRANEAASGDVAGKTLSRRRSPATRRRNTLMAKGHISIGISVAASLLTPANSVDVSVMQ